MPSYGYGAVPRVPSTLSVSAVDVMVQAPCCPPSPAISSITLTPGRTRDIDQDMEALRLSRQDNPFLQVNHCLPLIVFICFVYFCAFVCVYFCLYVHLWVFLSVYIQGLGIKSRQLFLLARLIDHEETWKYTNGSGWCLVLLDVRVVQIKKKKN